MKLPSSWSISGWPNRSKRMKSWLNRMDLFCISPLRSSRANTTSKWIIGEEIKNLLVQVIGSYTLHPAVRGAPISWEEPKGDHFSNLKGCLHFREVRNHAIEHGSKWMINWV
jgi:hypothetical protein